MFTLNWKTIAKRSIFEAPNGAKVYQNLMYRWLTFDNRAIHTLINRYQPNHIELRYIHELTLAVRMKPGASCLLGLGGAGIAHALLPYLNEIPLHVVEYDQEIINIAARYFMTDRLKNMTIFHQDAAQFVANCNIYYPHLMVDLFDKHSFPENCNTKSFFKHCHRILEPEGIMAFNLANFNDHWSLFHRIREQFGQRTISLPVKGTANLIVLAYHGDSLSPLLELLKKSACLKLLTWDEKWGCIGKI